MEGTSAHRPPSTFWHSASPQPSSRYGGEEHGPKNTITAFVCQIQATWLCMIATFYCFAFFFCFCSATTIPASPLSLLFIPPLHTPPPQQLPRTIITTRDKLAVA